MFSSALESGQLGPLMNQFGLPTEAVEAANKGGQYTSNVHKLIWFIQFLNTCLYFHITYVNIPLPDILLISLWFIQNVLTRAKLDVL